MAEKKSLTQKLKEVAGLPVAEMPTIVPTQPAEELVDVLQAADAIDGLARLFQNMVKASAALRQVGQYANTVRELETRIDTLRVEERICEAALSNINQKMDVARIECRKMQADAATVAATVKAEAKSAAETILETAKSRAAAIDAGAKTAADASVVRAQQAVQALGEEANTLRAAIQELGHRRGERTEELGNIEQRIRDARAVVAQIIGGEA